jgi:Secretion system C-terminal sorting domain
MNKHKKHSTLERNPRLVAQTLLSVLFAFCAYTTNVENTFAQSLDTVRVPFNRTELTQSNTRLWQNALYRWTVQGRANIGRFATAPTSGLPITVDARFFATNLGITTLPQRPVMPLDANAGALATCNAFLQMSVTSPCNIYFATNALQAAQIGAPATLDPAFALSNAVQMKRYAFRPTLDEFQENARYTLSVLGVNTFAQFVFVDGLGFGNNQAYRDNPADTALVVQIERESPELLVLAEPSFNATNRLPMRVLNDNVMTRVLRDTTLDFGAFFIGGGIAQTRRIVLKNRGIEPLRIVRIEVPNPDAAFSVTSSLGRLDNEVLLGQNADSLVLTLTFTPREARQYSQEVRIITNDATNTAFTLRLQGAGALGTLLQLEPLNFGDVRVNTQPTRNFTLLRSANSETFSIDSIQQPTQPFEVRNLAPQVIPANSMLMQTGFVIFRPNVIGAYLDSVVLRGQNLVDYKIYLTGRGIQAAASILRSPPLRNGSSQDTLDFGALPSGASTTQTFSVRNTGNLALNVALNLQSSPNGRPSDVGEFTLDTAPTSIRETTGAVQSYTVRFVATPQMLDGRKEAQLLVIVRDPSNGAEVLRQLFTLIARRLPNVIAPSRTVVDFDSVYIGIQARDTVAVRNTSQSLTGTLIRQSPVSAPFAADTLRPIRTFGVGEVSSLGFTFQPIQIGVQNTEFVLTNRLDSTSATETSRIQLRGVGVRQQFEVMRITSDSLFPNNTNTLNPASTLVGNTRTYVADLGCVRLGENKEIRLTFQNRGNIPFGVWNQFFGLNPTQTQDFTVIRRFQQERRIPPDGQDTSLRIRFTPRIVGEQQIQYTLQSDIKRNIGGTVRVPTAPDSTEQIIIIIRARGIVPEVDAPQAIQFDDVTIGSACGNRSLKSVAITNPASADCGTFTRILSVRLNTPNSAFRLASGQAGFTVRPSTSSSINIEFAPTILGNLTDELILTTDALPPRDVLRVRLVGRALELPNVLVSIATTHSAAPGSRITVPVRVRPSTVGSFAANTNALTLTDKVRFQVSYDATLLEFVNVAIDGTASAGAKITTQTSIQGTLRTVLVNIESQTGARLLARDTLAALVFSTYLGKNIATELALSGIRFGDSTCARIRLQGSENGSFQLDSVCNLQGKVDALGKIPPVLAEITPNPVVDNYGKITFYLSEQAHVTATLLDAQGAPRAVLVDDNFTEGTFEKHLPVTNLPTGTYFCEIRAGNERVMRKFVVLR